MALFNQYGLYFCIAVTVILLFLIILVLKFSSRLRTVERRYQTLCRGLDGADWHALMLELNDDVARLNETTAAHQRFLHALDERTQVQFCRRAIIHYDAFDYVYGQLSFSAALLDEHNDGFIFSNIHGRQDARCYLKEVKAGNCEQLLSDEEKFVLQTAKGGLA